MVFFVAGLMTLRPHHYGKSEKMRLRTRVWAQAPKPSSFAESFLCMFPVLFQHFFFCKIDICQGMVELVEVHKHKSQRDFIF